MKFIATLLLLAAVAVGARAADIVFFRGSPERLAGHVGAIPDEWFPRMVLIGAIAPGDDRRFAQVLAEAEAHNNGWDGARQLFLESPGGDVATAMSIGRIVRRGKFMTHIAANRACASACILVLVGGVQRFARDGARIGLHRPYFRDSRAADSSYETFQRAYGAVLDAHRAYFQDMGIGGGVLDLMKTIPSNEVRWIDETTAIRLTILGQDASYMEWERARRISSEGAACVEWKDRFWRCIGKFNARFDAETNEYCIAETSKPPECK